MDEQRQKSGPKPGAQERWHRAARHTSNAGAWWAAQAQEAVDRAPEAQEWVKTQARTLAERFSASSDKDDVVRLEQALTDIVAAIRQISHKQASRMVGIIVSKAGAVAAVGGITGLISMFGTASTGTAIGSLSGAAATSAQLYWVGSLVGLGAAGGGALLTGTGLGLGVAAWFVVRRKLYGKYRSVDQLQDYERAALASCIPVIKALQEQAETGEKHSAEEMRIVAEQVLIPLVHHIELHWDNRSLADAGLTDVRPFTATLAPVSLRKLQKATDEISRIAVGAMK